MAKVRVPKNSRHIRYYSEVSEDFYFEHPLALHHLVFVNDSKGIRKNLNQVVQNINEIKSGPEVKIRLEGKVRNSNLNFRFVTIKTLVNLEILKLRGLGIQLVKDKELYERKYLKVEDYVSRLYEE